MTDKIQKIREKVERLKSQLIKGACASQIAMETRCKEEAYNEVLAILDSTQEVPISKEWIEELRAELDSMSKEDFKKVFNKYAIDFKEEPVSEKLIDVAKQYVKEHVIGIDKVTFSIATDMFISGAKWQEKKDQEIIETAIHHAYHNGRLEMKEQMMAKAIDVEVKVDAGGYPYIDKTIELYDYCEDVPLAKEGDRYKVILIKEE